MKRFNVLVYIWHNHYYQHPLYQLPKSFKTISSLTNTIDRHRLDKYDRICYNPPTKLHQLSHVLDKCAETGDLYTGKLVHTHLIKLEFNGLISFWNKLLGLYCKCGHFQCARRTFAQMPQRDVVSFNTMISTYVRNNRDDVHEVLKLYSMMKEENAKPNHITLAGLVGACDVLDDARLREVLHAQAIRYGLSCNEFVGSSLVDGYAKERRLDAAIIAFEEIAELDIVSWNIMIDACVRNNSKEDALKIFSRMLLENVGFDSFTLTSVVKTCSEQGDLYRGMLIHGCAMKSGLDYETPICNSLITMYSKCEIGMTSAEKIFRRILAPSIISWTAIIAGFMKDGQNEEAIGLYKKMLRFEVKENDFSFASILSVYSNLATLEHGRQIHARTVKSWFGSDISVNNALIDMYSKCGSLEDAHLVFMRMKKHDIVSCTTMITGFAQHGKERQALDVLEQMTRGGLVPDDVTFLGCLSACSHGGLVDEGLRVFRMMTDVHSLKPRREHFASVVLAWEALLGACRLHGDMGLGEKSAKKILELQPDRHGAYVLLANMYADKGLWEDKGVVREKLVESRLKKEAGSSWVALQTF